MQKSRDNHYVPQWYQQGFFEPGQTTLHLLDTSPPRKTLSDGRLIVGRSTFPKAPTSRCFFQTDLYSTFFGTAVNDEIERKLFGSIDDRAAKAIKAFCSDDVREWHRHFGVLFEHIDAQKIRTPKGLDWLRGQYPNLSQNDLMEEMQGIRMMHSTIWTEGVREIVSAEGAAIKFLVSDHPVTIYNYAIPPFHQSCKYPSDPDIVLKASQTVYPLNRDFCLILTNLEYAKNPLVNPVEKRTFARHFRQSMVRTDSFIRKRKLCDREVSRINFLLKARARRYIAAGRDEWLYPERTVTEPWADIRETLLPKDELWRFGGELYAKLKDGSVYYQDQFGRKEKSRDFLVKAVTEKKPHPRSACGCGSGKNYMSCCMKKPVAQRPTWCELSIRERNLALHRGVVGILGFDKGKDWDSVRRDLTDQKISDVYSLYEALWPLETDILHLLPKPDGNARAVYTGLIHPRAIWEFALGSSLYFGELIIQTPFMNNGILADKFKPVNHPRMYRQEFLKTIFFFLTVMPLIDLGIVNLIPDPCDFDHHLRQQMYSMAQARAHWLTKEVVKELRAEELIKEDAKRTLLCLPRDVHRAQFQKAMPHLVGAELEEALDGIRILRERDPLCVLQDDSITGDQENGQLTAHQLLPNFEIAMYLAQATGASVITDNKARWNEILQSVRGSGSAPTFGLRDLAKSISASVFRFPSDVEDITALSSEGSFIGYQALMRDAYKYLPSIAARSARPNVEANLTSRFKKVHDSAQAIIGKSKTRSTLGRVTCAFPVNGIQANTINRLLLMSSSDNYLSSVPMAFFMENSDLP